jgi:hypothetical protein
MSAIVRCSTEVAELLFTESLLQLKKLAAHDPCQKKPSHTLADSSKNNGEMGLTHGDTCGIAVTLTLQTTDTPGINYHFC